ncbi:DsbA family protein [Brevundimonas sp.]|uniref:DsbA family protein n=1 Tax=Brevundimonas sp. TaxID=1871086 RepID=UPI0035AFC411
MTPRTLAPAFALALALAACGPADADNGAAPEAGPAQTPPSIAPTGFNDLLRDPGVPFIGAAEADVTIISFVDYNCPYCKQMQPELTALVESDPKVRILYKEWPIFGAPSQLAARTAIAAQFQGKYEAVHNAFMGSPTPISGEADVERLARSAGVDMDRLERDMTARVAEIDAVLRRVGAEATAMALRGTPAFSINGQMIPGALPPGQLAVVVGQVRAAQSAAR